MSVAMGTDLQSATVMVGKALQDPVAGLTALRRIGVSFTADQQKQIRTLAESGRGLEAQKLILAELAKEFGGAAVAAGEGFEGSVARAKDAVDDAFRAIGERLLPSLTQLANWVTENATPASSWLWVSASTDR